MGRHVTTGEEREHDKGDGRLRTWCSALSEQVRDDAWQCPGAGAVEGRQDCYDK